MEKLPDALQAAPNIYKQLMENNRVRVFELKFKPGEKASLHTHPDHIVYVMSGQKLQLTSIDGKKTDVDLSAGQAIWMDAGPHSAQNTGKTEARFLVVELKK